MIVISPLHKIQVCDEPPPSVLNMTLPAFAAERRRMQHGARSYQSIAAANPPADVAAVDRWDRETDDRQTPVRYIDPAPHTMYTFIRNECRNIQNQVEHKM